MIEQHTTLLEANVSPLALTLAGPKQEYRDVVVWLGVVRTHIEDLEHDASKARKKAA